MSKAEIYTAIAFVYKTSVEKIPVFAELLKARPSLLTRCIVFVETHEYGDHIIGHIHEHQLHFHTYYSGQDKEVLRRFAAGELECLITCHRLSEGIDIRSLSNVVLFSSARARLEIIQRIGRCLRVDPTNPTKVANIVDFIREDDEANCRPESVPTDIARRDWLTRLATVRPSGVKT
jgi:superfamily II DNA or RNA helicase